MKQKPEWIISKTGNYGKMYELVKMRVERAAEESVRIHQEIYNKICPKGNISFMENLKLHNQAEQIAKESVKEILFAPVKAI